MLVDEVVLGSATFEWLEGGHFVVLRSRNDHELFPDAISVIGRPESGEGRVMEYFDSRGVRRTYGVALEDGVLRMWRDDPDFAQRYSATIGSQASKGPSRSGKRKAPSSQQRCFSRWRTGLAPPSPRARGGLGRRDGVDL